MKLLITVLNHKPRQRQAVLQRRFFYPRKMPTVLLINANNGAIYFLLMISTIKQSFIEIGWLRAQPHARESCRLYFILSDFLYPFSSNLRPDIADSRKIAQTTRIRPRL
jgi:hypothetical protein